MEFGRIIAISGKPGLFYLVAQGRGNIIVESLIDGKKRPAYATDKISALDDISIYTVEEDVPLIEVFLKIYEKTNGENGPSHKSTTQELRDFLLEVLPDYDEERVFDSDVKKLFQWFNMLNEKDVFKLELEARAEAEKAEKDAAKKEKKAKKEEVEDKAE